MPLSGLYALLICIWTMLAGRFMFDVKYVPILDTYWSSLGWALVSVAFILSLYLYARARLFANADEVNPNGNTGVFVFLSIPFSLFRFQAMLSTTFSLVTNQIRIFMAI